MLTCVPSECRQRFVPQVLSLAAVCKHILWYVSDEQVRDGEGGLLQVLYRSAVAVVMR